MSLIELYASFLWKGHTKEGNLFLDDIQDDTV